jgi:hypothetical protein
MRRRLLTCLSLAAVPLWLAVCVAWVTSYATARRWVSGSHPGVVWEVRSARGWVSVERNEVLFWPRFRDGNLWAMRADERYRPGGENPGGIYFFRDESTFRRRLPGEERPGPLPEVEKRLPKQTWSYQSRVGLAYPLLCVVTATPPLVWLWRRRSRTQRRRLAAGLCTGCGYDLRATPGRCPECGAAAPHAAAEARE